SVVTDYGGSNPPAPIEKNLMHRIRFFSGIFALRRVILVAPVIFASQVILGFARFYFLDYPHTAYHYFASLVYSTLILSVNIV
ncbi:MAG: hypothetical protein II350_03965, partial [Clostridia bacterium]|nr:hypothetical protein [Clostridia bacterium]